MVAYCIQCGSGNADGFRFCSKCGAGVPEELREGADDPQPAVGDSAASSSSIAGAQERSRRPWMVFGSLGLLLVVLAGFAWVLTRPDDTPETPIAAEAGAVDDQTGARDEAEEAAPATTTFPEVVEAAVVGEALPPLAQSDVDEAVGMMLPVLSGPDQENRLVTIGADGEPKLIVAMAHWCPHCQAELPELVSVADGRGFIEGVEVIAISTFVNSGQANYPPEDWFERERWQGRLLLDDDESTVAMGLGVAAVPTWIAVDANGTVVARKAGAIGEDQMIEFAAAVSGEATAMSQDSPYRLGWTTLESKDDTQDLVLVYPQLQSEVIDAFVAAQAQSEFDGVASSAVEMVESDPEVCGAYPAYLSGMYDVTFASPELVSVSAMTHSSFCGGTGGSSNPVWNLRIDGSQVDISDSITDIAALIQLVEPWAEEHLAPMELWYDDVEELRLGVSLEALNVHFGKYEIAPGAAGAPVVPIPWGEVEHLLVEGSPAWNVAKGLWEHDPRVGPINGCAASVMASAGLVAGGDTPLGTISEWWSPQYGTACLRGVGIASLWIDDGREVAVFDYQDDELVGSLSYFTDGAELHRYMLDRTQDENAAAVYLRAGGASWAIP